MNSQFSSPSHPRVCLAETKKMVAISSKTKIVRSHCVIPLGLGSSNITSARCLARQPVSPRRLGIAEAAVVLEHLRALGGHHQPRVEHSVERGAPAAELVDDRLVHER